MSEKKLSETTAVEIKNETEEPKKITQKEFEKMVLDLAKKELTSEKIGEELRKQKIHSKEYSKKISKILKEENLYILPDLKNMQEKFKRVEEHLKKNKQDKRALREKSRFLSDLGKIKKYHKIET